MSDPMTTVTNYDALVKKYGNFMVPAMKVKVNDVEITKTIGIRITHMEVKLGLKDASSANFQIVGDYDLETSSFSSLIKKCIRLGYIISIELGYGSDTTTVFYGYVSEISMNFSDVPSISVTALDVMRLLMNSNKANLRFEKKTYSEIVNEVMKKYKKVYKKLVMDPTTEKLDEVVQHESDYQFINGELVNKANREFFALAGNVYFRIPRKNAVPIMKLKWGKTLLNFNVTTSYCDEIIIVQGVDQEKKVKIEAKEKAKSDSKIVSLTTTPIQKIIVKPELEDIKSAAILAKSEAEKRVAQCRNGRGTTIGLPELVPGRFISLDKLDSIINSKVYLSSVSHSFGDGGFTTRFEIGGW